MNFSFPRLASSLLIQSRSSLFPFATAGAIVSWFPNEVIPTVKLGFTLAQAISSVLSLAIASPRLSFNASNISEY